MSDEETPAYAARCKCGCRGLIYAAVDPPDIQTHLSPKGLKLHRADMAKVMAKLVRSGFAIERSTVGEVRKSKFGCRKGKVTA